MTVVRCPRCRDEVTVPPRATSRALVRCPLCLEQYLLAEALANSPPPLIIIGGEVADAAIERSPESDDYRIAGGGFSAAALENTAHSSSAVVTLPRPMIKGRTRPRRQEKSGLVFLASVILGGLLAAPLAQLTLWWVFHVDRLDLGPTVARYAQWIVPPEFHGMPIPEPATEIAVPIARPNTRKKRAETTTIAEPPPTELQTLPGLDETQPSTNVLRPAIDAPILREPENTSQKKSKPTGETPATKSDRADAAPKAAPPMPDLTDLLPN